MSKEPLPGAMAAATTSHLQPWQQRVLEEKSELDDKLRKLNLFMQSERIHEIADFSERSMLMRQRSAMQAYSQVLGERIVAFKGAQA